MSREELAAFLAREGFAVAGDLLDEMFVAYGQLEAMKAQVRAPRPLSVEPAHRFRVTR